MQFDTLRNKVFPASTAIIVTSLALVGCNSTSQIDNTLGSTAAQQPAEQTEVQDLRAYCPKTVLRAGTEKIDIYPPKVKKDDPDAAKLIRVRGAIADVVRECNYAGDFLNMKVGVAGRVISGPAAETGQFQLPLRIAVTQGDQVLYSQLHDMVVEIPFGRTNNTFSFVDSAISIAKPSSENIVVYVGFDELRSDVPGARPVANDGRIKKPVN